MTTTTDTPVTVQEMFSSIVALTAALNRSSDISERLLAGQQAALDKVEAPKATRGRKAKEDAAPAAEEVKAESAAEKVVEEKPAAAEKAPETPSLATGEAVKTHALSWINEVAKTDPVRKERGDFVLAVQNHLGTKLGELTDADEIKQAVFFIERKKAGHDVDFGAEYDFDAAVDQEVAGGDEEDFG